MSLLFMLLIIVMSTAVTSTGRTQSYLFAKLLAATDENYYSLFSNLYYRPQMLLGSLIECAALASASLINPDKYMRASAFLYKDKVCQLGRTPPYADWMVNRSAITDGVTEGAHVLMKEKPMASVVLSDLFAYVLLNEQQAYNVHPNLPYPPYPPTITTPDNYTYDFGSLDYIFGPKLSPVQTLEGQYAGVIISGVALQLQFAEAKTFSSFTVLVWYNNGPVAPIYDQLILVLNDGDDSDFLSIELWAMVDGSYQLQFYNDRNHIYNITTAANLNPGDQWVYVGATYDGTTGLSNIYMNGTSLQQTTFPTNINLPNMTNLEVGDNWFNDYNMTYLEGGDNWFNASNLFNIIHWVASVEVYDRALLQKEVADAMILSTTKRVGG